VLARTSESKNRVVFAGQIRVCLGFEEKAKKWE
jgi:hypothetical protein